MLLTIAQVRERVPVSRPTIYALIKRANFPRPQKVPGKGNVSFWSADAVDTWASVHDFQRGAGA